MASPQAKHHWLVALQKVTKHDVQQLIDRLAPVLSDPARTFAAEVLRINQRRLLDECH